MDAADWFIVLAPLAMMALGMLGWAMEGRETMELNGELYPGEHALTLEAEREREVEQRLNKWFEAGGTARVDRSIVEEWAVLKLESEGERVDELAVAALLHEHGVEGWED